MRAITQDKFKGYIYRSFLWNIMNLFLCIFSMFYLVKFDEIKNWNGLLVFLPLLIIAVSSETMTRNKELKANRVKPYSIIDFMLKILVYILAQVAYRRLLNENMFFVLFSLTVLLGVVSFYWKV